MEIFGTVINEAGDPVPFATVQRRYPDGQDYSNALMADMNGYFNGRVPDDSYTWIITSVGYKPVEVSLNGYMENANVMVRMQKDYQDMPEVVVTPAAKKNIAIGLVAAALVYYGYKQNWF